MSSFEKKAFAAIMIGIVIILIFSVSKGDLGRVAMILGTLLGAYAILWAITIPYMIWAVLPGNRPKPLARKWGVMGWALLILGYPPALIIALLSYNQPWDWTGALLIAVFLGPIFVYAVCKIKNRFAIQNYKLNKDLEAPSSE